MTVLYDVRFYRASAKGHTPANGFYVGTVREVKGGIQDWPDDAAVRECLPHQHRKAFDRSFMWWRNDSIPADKGNVSRMLRDCRGSSLGTLYAYRREV